MTSRRALEFIGITRPVIVGAAYDIVERLGVERLSAKLLAKEIGLPPRYLDKYFKSPDDLQDELTVRALQGLIAVHQDVRREQVGREALDAFALAERSFGLAHPMLYPLALRPPRREHAELVRLRGVHVDFAAAMVAGYRVRDDLVYEVARCLSMALQGFISAEINSMGVTRLEFDRNYERLLDMLDLGARSAAQA